ncbi:MAG: SCP2 sterol-binding domain-containing protein [Lachnospiraceae bacterium]|nr:SCP2 sterol-binding domain-containing protein [Lachnospiraceae bacterium]
MTYAEYFSSIKTEFMGADVSDIQEHLAYQFNIIGEGSGIFYVEVKGGELHIEPYEYFDRHAMFTATTEIFTDMIRGKIDPVWAFTIGKLKVEGDFEKALKLKQIIDKNKKKKSKS